MQTTHGRSPLSRSNSPRRRRGPSAPPIHSGLCPVTGKYRYTSRRLARDHRRRLVAEGDTRPVSVYKCRGCETWHVGHRA